MSFEQLKRYTDEYGPRHKTEDWCLFMYALVKMQRPSVFLELGTGWGVTLFWVAQAMQENGLGACHSVDSSRMWKKRSRKGEFTSLIQARAEEFGLADRITLIDQEVPPFPEVEGVDLLFSDISPYPGHILDVLGHYLPTMPVHGSIFFDSAAGRLQTYWMMSMLVDELNRGRVPARLLSQVASEKRNTLIRRVITSRFELIPITKVQERLDQNGPLWFRFSPSDLVPYPQTLFRD